MEIQWYRRALRILQITLLVALTLAAFIPALAEDDVDRDIERALSVVVNEVRLRYGFPQLASGTRLKQAARAHLTEFLARKRRFLCGASDRRGHQGIADIHKAGCRIDPPAAVGRKHPEPSDGARRQASSRSWLLSAVS